MLVGSMILVKISVKKFFYKNPTTPNGCQIGSTGIVAIITSYLLPAEQYNKTDEQYTYLKELNIENFYL